LYLREQGCEDPYFFVEAKSGPRAQILGNAPPDLTPFDFCLWGCKKSEIDKINFDTRDELLARIFDAAALVNKREDNSDEKYVIFAHELQSALKLTVWFTNSYCEL